MTKITFIEFGGDQHEIDAENGQSLMSAAVDNLIPGIDADCGGECSCATCHVILSADWYAKTGPAGETESSMLDLSQERVDTSRLSCQIEITDALDGMVVNIPEYQV